MRPLLWSVKSIVRAKRTSWLVMYWKKRMNINKVIDILPPYSQNGTEPSFCARYGGLKLYLYSNLFTIWSLSAKLDNRATAVAVNNNGKRGDDEDVMVFHVVRSRPRVQNAVRNSRGTAGAVAKTMFTGANDGQYSLFESCTVWHIVVKRARFRRRVSSD